LRVVLIDNEARTLKLKSVLLVIVFVVQSICVFAEVDSSMLEVTSTRFMKEFSYDETQSYNDVKTKVYEPSGFMIFEINSDDLPVSLIWDGYRESP
jgi:ABC-type phosphate/phosphonate transport system permease subunit